MLQLGGPYLVEFGLGTGEGEGEAHWKVLVLDVLLLHEVPQAVGHVVKQLPHNRQKISDDGPFDLQRAITASQRPVTTAIQLTDTLKNI